MFKLWRTHKTKGSPERYFREVFASEAGLKWKRVGFGGFGAATEGNQSLNFQF